MNPLILKRILLCLLGLSLSSGLAQSVSDSLLGVSLIEKAKVAYAAQQTDSAKLLLEQASDLFEGAEYWDAYCSCQNQIANILRLERKWQESSELLRPVEVICRTKLGKEHHSIAEIHTIWAVNAIYLGSVQKAREHFLISLKILEAVESDPSTQLSNAYINLANTYARLGDFDSAAQRYESGIAILVQMEETSAYNLGFAYHSLGQFLLEQGKYQKAINKLELALGYIQGSVGEKHAKGIDIFISLGAAYHKMADLGQARLMYQKVLDLVRNVHPDPMAQAALAHYNLGISYQDERVWPQAIFHLKKAYEETQGVFGPRHLRTATSLSTLGNVYQHSQHPDLALEVQKKAVNILTQIEDSVHTEAGDIYLNLAHTMHVQGLGEQALKYGVKGMSLIRTFYGEKAQARISFYLAKLIELYVHDDQDSMVLKLCQEGYQAIFPEYHSPNLHDNPGEECLKHAHLSWRLLLGQSKALESLAEKGRTMSQYALGPALLAVKALDTMEQRFLSPFSRKEVQKDVLAVYSHAIRLLYDQYQRVGDQSYINQAFLLADQSKSRLLQASLLQDEALSFAGIPDSLMQLEQQLEMEKVVYEKKLYEEKFKQFSDSNKLRILERTRNQLAERYRAFVLQLEKNYPKYYRLKYERAQTDIRSIQTALAQDAELINFFIGEKHLYMFGLGKNNLLVARQDWGTEERNTLNQFLDMMKDREVAENQSQKSDLIQTFGETANHWYEYLLQPVVMQGIKHIRIIPDGNLARLPFEVLLTEPPQSNKLNYKFLSYLIQETSISYGFNASLETTNWHGQTAPSPYLGIAPDFQFVETKSNSADSLTFFASNRDSFGPLANNTEEIELSSNIWEGKSLLGKEATKARFMEEAHLYRILHIATHAYTNDQNPLYGGLVFGEEETELLEAYEIYQLQLKADLSILSACKTGLGEWQRGEGIMSLARAFRYAGCPGITMSLWSADDAATSIIMQQYLTLLKTGIPKDEALRLAKIEYLNTSPQPHPFYWAAFVHTGMTQPLRENRDWMRWILLSLIFGGLLLIILWRRNSVSGKFSA
ncbi:MAG: CHAT domain-containing tetratricopeptide repeat protein [Bacteroidota bacterium]